MNFRSATTITRFSLPAALLCASLWSGATLAQQPRQTPDIDNIGTRDITAGLPAGLPSVEAELATGRRIAQEFEQAVTLSQDSVVVEYIDRIGQNIVRNSDARTPFTIKVVESDEIAAVALPGGFFYVNTGLILAADDEAELAGAIAHQIAHIAARHTAQQRRGHRS